MTRLAVIVSDGNFDVGKHPHCYGVGIVDKSFVSCYDVRDCAVQVIRTVFHSADIEVSEYSQDSNKIRVRFFTKNRISYYDTTFLYKSVETVVDFPAD